MEWLEPNKNETFLFLQVLQKWYTALCAKQEFFEKLQIASCHRDKHLLQEMWMKWSVYIRERRWKFNLKGKKKDFYFLAL